jgi:hypothetical protein
MLLVSIIVSGCVGAGSGQEAAANSPLAPTTSSAGPASGPSTSAAANATSDQDTRSKALHFEQSFQLKVTHVNAPNGDRFNTDPNCVSFGKDQVWLITNGTAEATWSPTSVFASKMTLDVRDIGLMATNKGATSPTTLQYGPFQTVPNALLGLLFVVQPTDPGVVYGQAVALKLSFDYFGKQDLETQVVPCVYKTAAQAETEGRA